jgi:hypothetical protein
VFVKGPTCARGESYAEGTEGEQCKRFYVRSRFIKHCRSRKSQGNSRHERDLFSPFETSGHR